MSLHLYSNGPPLKNYRSMLNFDALPVPSEAIVEFDNRGFPVEFTPVPASGK